MTPKEIAIRRKSAQSKLQRRRVPTRKTQVSLAKTSTPDTEHQRLEGLKLRAQDFSTKAVLVSLPEIIRYYLGTEDRQLQMFRAEQQKKHPDITEEELQKIYSEYAERFIHYTDQAISYRTQLIVGKMTQDNFPEIYPKTEEKEPQNDAPVAVEAEFIPEKPIRRISEETKPIRAED